MSSEVLTYPEGRETLSHVVTDYLTANSGSTAHRATEWEAMKAVIWEACMGLTYGVRKQLQSELRRDAVHLAALQAQDLTHLNSQVDENTVRRQMGMSEIDWTSLHSNNTDNYYIEKETSRENRHELYTEKTCHQL
ncbi:hypothetical protein NDU88_000245 [Pleurodeles waltl]|uniref:Uncharacterized protein n=1 Tax=Pleurodeles waltl TaxID=8319 RepID=A0AAV7UQS0_PLEWA|nr:hypothetical protein NDU88_000245 [Pleurodeles waltl]